MRKVKVGFFVGDVGGTPAVELVIQVMPRGGGNARVLREFADLYFGPGSVMERHVLAVDVRSSRLRVWLKPGFSMVADYLATFGPLDGSVLPVPGGVS